MSTFESGVRLGRRAEPRFVSAGAGEESLRSTVRLNTVSAARRDGARSAAAELTRAGARLVFPTLLLVTAIAAAVIYGTGPALWLGNGDVGNRPFEAEFAALPLTFLIVQLTNRRYGGGYAALQVLAALVVVIGIGFYGLGDLLLLRGAAMPSLRVLAGFGGGLIVAQLVSIVVFDCLRGPVWWQAPLSASLAGGATLAFIAYPAIYYGTNADWFGPMMTYFSVTAAAAVVQLLPYWLLRPLVAPIAGFGGY